MSTSKAIADALEAHFVHPDDPTSGVVMREVTAPDSQRRIDVLAMSLWPSRGYGIDAVEIKVAKADYEREIANPAKADPWWRNSNRFWIAAPSTAVADPDRLPPGWGLLVPGNSRRFKVVVKAEERRFQPSMALLAAIVGRGVNTARDSYERKLFEARDELHRKHSRDLSAVRSELLAAADPEVKRALDMIRGVESAAGARVEEWSYGDNFRIDEFGRAVRLALDMGRAGKALSDAAAELAAKMRNFGTRLTATAGQLEDPEGQVND